MSKIVNLKWKDDTIDDTIPFVVACIPHQSIDGIQIGLFGGNLII